jgi:Flp pilus assembly protein TadB
MFISNTFGYFSILLMGILTLLLPVWLQDWSLKALKSQDWISIQFFRRESRFLKRVSLWSVAASGFVSWATTGSFAGATLFLLVLPLFFLAITAGRYSRIKNKVAQDFMTNLYAIKGLLEVGTPFPQAVQFISEESSSQATFLLSRIVRGFQNGKSLATNFKNLEFKSPGEWVYRSLILIEQAYRKGLALSPLVESLLQILELEFQAEKRLKRLQTEIWVQVGVASVIPWILSWVCWTFQPEIMEQAMSSSSGKLLLLVIIFWEGIGIWVLRKVNRFY